MMMDNKFSFSFHIAHTHPSGGVDVPVGGYHLHV